MTWETPSLPSAGSTERILTISGITLLRLALGIMFLAHSLVLKWLTYSLPGTAQFFLSVGLPAWLAYLTFFAEALGGLLLVLGIETRWVALALSPFPLGALITVHWHNGWVFTAPNGGWEYPAYLFVLCIAQALMGGGTFTIARPLRRKSRSSGQSHQAA
jgi:putative oxidoreductase